MKTRSKNYIYIFVTLLFIFTISYSINIQASVTDGLIAWYPLDNNATDQSGNGNNGELVGPASTPGIIGGAQLYNGMSDYIIVSDSDSLDIGASDFTIAGWVQVHNTQRFNALVEKRGVEGTHMTNLAGYNFAIYPPGNLSLAFQDINGTNPWGNGQTILTPNTWYHVAVVVHRDTSAIFYVNGQPDGSFEVAGANASLAGPGSLLLGKRENYPWDDLYLDGALDDVRIYNRALSQAEISELALGDSNYSDDVDGDGYRSDVDCNDNDLTIYPGAPEACDGKDNNCDGIVPEWDVDQDGDGYLSCSECDDTTASIHPGAAELPGNYFDEDCNGDLGNCSPNEYWKNHGQYVRCVSQEAERLVEIGVISQEQADQLVSSSAQTSIGKN